MKSVFVFGDAILDHDIFVRLKGTAAAEGLAAPLYSHKDEIYSLGGAGRVAATLAMFPDTQAKLFTCGGQTGSGFMFTQAAERANVRLGLCGNIERGVSLKQRIWDTTDTPRLLMRIDSDERHAWKSFDSAYLDQEDFHDADCVAIVSHDKGCCSAEFKQAVMCRAIAANLVVVVDPGKDDELAGYGSQRTVIKLNARQAQRLAATKLPTPEVFDWDTRQSEEVYFELMHRVVRACADVTYAGIWLTLGPGGMMYLRRGTEPTAANSLRVRHSGSDTVVDSCGAGDAAMAAFAATIEDADLDDPVKLLTRVSDANAQAWTACKQWRWLR